MRSTPSRHPAGRIAAALALALALALSGCGGDSDGESSDADATTQPADPSEAEAMDVPDLCALLSAEDFEAVTGAPAAGEPDATAASGAIRGMCTWTAEAGFPVLMIGAYDAADREETLDLVDAEPVEGLGTDAEWAEETGLLFVVGDQDWYLQVLVMGTDDDKAASVAGAEIVLENLF